MQRELTDSVCTPPSAACSYRHGEDGPESGHFTLHRGVSIAAMLTFGRDEENKPFYAMHMLSDEERYEPAGMGCGGPTVHEGFPVRRFNETSGRWE
jgi:hypothetical protein